VIEPLAHPERFGGKIEDAFEWAGRFQLGWALTIRNPAAPFTSTF
jgi:hypothetical protein